MVDIWLKMNFLERFFWWMINCQSWNGNSVEKQNRSVIILPLITAWYAPDVPVNQGPGEYWGLPGLILEVKDDVTVILCTKLVLNPTEKKEIKAPSKGKTVTQEEYDKISKDKMAEMRENFRRGGGGGGNRGGGGGRP